MKQLKTMLFYTILVLTVSNMPVNAQGPGFDEDVDDVPVPLDGGATLIAAGAVGYGIKKLSDRKNK